METKPRQHVVDILFVISLFCVFALSAIFLITVGASIYSRTMSNMGDNFSSRTAVAYMIEKVHQMDEQGQVMVGSYDGIPCIELKFDVNGIEYATYMYEYDGYLTELTKRTDIDLDPEFGQQIIRVNELKIVPVNDNLIHCVIKTETDEDYEFNIALHSKEDMDA